MSKKAQVNDMIAQRVANLEMRDCVTFVEVARKLLFDDAADKLVELEGIMQKYEQERHHDATQEDIAKVIPIIVKCLFKDDPSYQYFKQILEEMYGKASTDE